ncbi:DUF3037 domain-containing protein [Danxiaibacter flavus]|uniref:DUF3037 domain-containing protein n=1 Tax=Danxiaibacter flavus TaxID=3049108 RepID=A0ABV3Z8G2_9BACT|nr:DUF3037 domain-containing protein [Chitinophagaceae bacterium DXS]
MQEKHLFEYAVIRYVPLVEREEFLNVGVILFCKRLQFLQARFNIDEQKIKAFNGDADIAQLKEYLNAFLLIAEGNKNGGPISKLDPPSRFRWLTATRSTIVQTSKTHPGLCGDMEHALDKLFTQLVL